MSDNLTRYYAIRDALKRLAPTEPRGNQARHLNTLAHLVSGILGSRKTNLPAIASKTPDGKKRESRIKRYTRWLQNERISGETYFLPYARALLRSLPGPTLGLVMDASVVGRGCLALVVSVIYHKRALPVCWLVVSGPKGHLSEAQHTTLLNEVAALLPPGRSVVFLGDGEFDGTGLLAALARLGWSFVCRTQKNACLYEGTDDFRFAWLNIQPGEVIDNDNVFFTQEGFGPLLAVALWKRGHKDPLYLVSNLDLWQEAYLWYQKRFRVETLFSDQKSRGFYLCHSHLSDPKRLERLLIATCLAYLVMVCLGALVVQSGQLSLIHRTKRCDLSLFQIGLIWLDHCLNESLPLLVPLALVRERRATISVR